MRVPGKEPNVVFVRHTFRPLFTHGVQVRYGNASVICGLAKVENMVSCKKIFRLGNNAKGWDLDGVKKKSLDSRRLNINTGP
jgi:hypothetical protein